MTNERRTVDQRLWHLLDSSRGHIDAGQMADVLLWNAVEWRTGATGLPAPELEDLQRAARNARRRIPELDSLLDGEQQALSSYSPTQLRHYARLLLRPYPASDHRGAFTTSTSLVEVARTALTAYAYESRTEAAHLYDPACGSATLALDVAQALGEQTGTTVTVNGQDIDAATVRRARAHAFLLGADSSFSQADSLTQDAFPDRRFDYTVAEIPYNLSWRNSYEECTAEADRPQGRYPAGLPQPDNASLLFAQILVSKLRDPADGGGRGVMFTTTGPLHDAGGSAIRAWLLVQDLLDAVVVLPEGLSTSTGLRLHGLVFSNRKPAARRRKVQFIDLRGFYQDGDDRRLERRTISEAALDELSRSLRHAKPTAYSRTVAANDLSFRQVSVTHDATAITSRREPGEVPRLTMLLSATSTTEAWRDTRYATCPPSVTDVAGTPLTRFEVDRVFTTDRTPRALRSLTQLGWKTARLTELTEHLCYIPSTKAAERATMLSTVSGEQALVVPIEPHLDAVAGDPGEVAPDNRALVIRPRKAYTDAEYLAGWLNSPLGRHLRSAAVGSGGASYVSPRVVNLNHAWRMADDLLVALPDLPVQREMARAERALVAARRHLIDSHRELWNDPKKRSDIYREASGLIPSADLAQWTATLPFPMASALWVYESKGNNNLHARREQMFHFWEATIQFHATVTVSALLQDRSRLEQELPALAEQIRSVGLTPERATLGVWHIILQRLNKRYRTALNGTDTDEQARARAAFADAPPDFLDTLLSADLTNLFGEVIQRRNAWSGHSGTTTVDSLKEQLDILTGHVHTLRNLIGAGWQDFPLVRAGAARIRNRVFHHDVDLAMGPNAPFRQEQIPISVAMEEDGLYLLSREAGSALPLAPLIVMYPAAFGSNGGCYYFNRLQPEGVRFVAYHEAAQPERIEDAPPTAALAAALASGETAEDEEGHQTGR
ncbi:N-6 DNA methylase [Streptomyces sp. BG9H]|uniref:site-specific DNA-methyltransferase (adenine-specific) n=1 Tax=Streptomyces anatolicus TaxID=2675858 RepID=A0ABS6YMJ6_9ACTN|nr:N-6 DNA methylase [Streptomyces anatolicus]MBW5422643.1 N-6 DNA methylase [Streptomyces anatolicus]